MTKSSSTTKNNAADDAGSAKKKRSSRRRAHRKEQMRSGQTDTHAKALPDSVVFGPLEAAVLRDACRASSKYRRFVRAATAERLRKVKMQRVDRQTARALEKASSANTKKSVGRSSLYPLRRKAAVDIEEEDTASVPTGTSPEAVTAGRVASRLLLARAFDAQPNLAAEFASGTPVVLVDIPNENLLARVTSDWKGVLFPPTTRFMQVVANHTAAVAMVGSFGLTGPPPLLYLGPLNRTEDLLTYADVRHAANVELAKAADGCRKLLERNRTALEAIAEQLLLMGRIDGAAVQSLCEVHSSEAGLKARSAL